MKIIIDSSVIVAVISNEPQKPFLIDATKGHDLVAPVSIHAEIGNAFSAMFKRRRATLEQANQALDAYRSIAIQFVEIDLYESLRIADQYDIYAYDAYLLHCAKMYRSPFLTLDRALRRHATDYGISLVEVST